MVIRTQTLLSMEKREALDLPGCERAQQEGVTMAPVVSKQQKFCYSSPDITQQGCDVDATALFNKLKGSVALVLEASLMRCGKGLT